MQVQTMLLKTLAVLTLVLHDVSAIKVLAIFTLPLKSHYMAFKPLFEELAARGHSVTVMSNFPNEKPVLNFHDIDLHSPKNESKVFNLSFYDDFSKHFVPIHNFYRHCFNANEMTTEDCENIFTHSEVKKLMDSGVEYDVVFVEQFVSDCALAFANYYSKAPIIGITSHVLLPWTYSRLGLPFQYSADPFYFSNGGPNPTLIHKVETVLLNLYFNTVVRWGIDSSIRGVLQKHASNRTIKVEDIGKSMRMVFSYQYFPLSGARLLAPQVVEIGGMHIKKPKQLPHDLEQFIDSADKGVIYVSFGSMLKASTMSETKMKAFMSAFNDIPQKVIWKLENGSMSQTTEKILTSEWLPQLDILCHPNVIGFISHGGMLGTSEAASCGVPVITVPFFGDQFGNAASIRSSGLGVTLYYQDIDSATILESLSAITSERMQKKAKLISQLWHDRPLSPLESAIYWTEYVARYGDDAPPDLPTKRISLLESLLVDVYLALASILLILAVFVYLFIKLLLSVLFWISKKLVCHSKSKLE